MPEKAVELNLKMIPGSSLHLPGTESVQTGLRNTLLMRTLSN